LKVVELLLSHKFLLAVPIVLGALAGALLVKATQPPPYYISSASVWIDRPDVISGSTVTDFNPYVSPAQNQVGVLQELMASRSFVAAVAKDLNGTETASDRQILDIRRNTFIWAAGEHLLHVQFKALDRMRAARSVKAVLDQFTILYAKELKTKAEQSSVFYQAQLSVARETLETATLALQSYLRTHPQIAVVVNNASSNATITDPEYAKVRIAHESAKTNYDRILSSYSQSVIISNSSGSTSSYFEVLDQPQVPIFPVVGGRKLMVLKFGGGMILGGAISAAFLMWIWRTDRRVRTSTDLDFLGVEVFSLNAIKLPRRRRWPKEFVRLATAIAAGLQRGTGRQRGTAPLGHGLE
jgi:uncharacterized protein involved in exopolysaccharide biosynthesis